MALERRTLVTYEFQCKGHSLGFQVDLREAGSDAWGPVVAYAKHESEKIIRGECLCPAASTVKLVFDNKYASPRGLIGGRCVVVCMPGVVCAVDGLCVRMCFWAHEREWLCPVLIPLDCVFAPLAVFFLCFPSTLGRFLEVKTFENCSRRLASSLGFGPAS